MAARLTLRDSVAALRLIHRRLLIIRDTPRLPRATLELVRATIDYIEALLSRR